MSNTKLFQSQINVSSLNDIYNQYIYYSYAIGIDNINHTQFNKKINDELDLINRKLLSEKYKFSRYKLKLLNKGKGKPPREIYIPTIRDRVLLKAIQLFLQEVFKENLSQDLPQNIIKELKSELDSKKYNAFIKIDIKNFYPSIDRKILLKKIRSKIRNKYFSNLLLDALNPSKKEFISGVPQGLSISNILAHIYLISLDKKLSSQFNIKYFRFVDDILILLDMSNKDYIIEILEKEFSKVKLEIHPIKDENSKSKISYLSNGFDYLGYNYRNEEFSIRDSSINNLRNSIVECFTSYRYATSSRKNINFLLWRLNLKITGCIDNGKSKGWLFFFSQLSNYKILYELDHFVRKIAKQFKLSSAEINQIKRFSRTYFEITHNFYSSNYIPNFDKYNITMKKDILIQVFSQDLKGRSDEEIDDMFKFKTRKHINKLLIDLRNFS
ncbi:group II intron reverse transcriptase domain-containing protein [Acinetobacter calcoaceticus]|uniref:reverse transcriptase/maturase family protein n=1 Tax=Acinetobacter calcoaceticus TaxID=471 RepID=UPI0019003CC9|nr:reverse transcriptase/maturase family protein [Acinetobacter calcoaceticus]MBJ9723144.1 group II intron reverse transcriptase domain-containing protein [Acinetobacter calcoaceticus]